MDKIQDDVPPGAPTVVNDGPLLPALDTNITPCLFTTWSKKKRKQTEGKNEVIRLSIHDLPGIEV